MCEAGPHIVRAPKRKYAQDLSRTRAPFVLRPGELRSREVVLDVSVASYKVLRAASLLEDLDALDALVPK